MCGARTGTGATEPSATRTSRHAPSVRAPRDGHGNLADRLRAARADLAEADLPARRQGDLHPDEELVGGQRGPAVGEEEARGGDATLPTDAGDDERRVGGEEDGQHVAGRRRVRDVPADRAAGLDLRGADRGGRLREDGQVLGDERRAAQLGVGRERAEDEGWRAPASSGRSAASAASRIPRSSSSAHRSRSGRASSSPPAARATMTSVPPAIGRQGTSARRRSASASVRGETVGEAARGTTPVAPGMAGAGWIPARASAAAGTAPAGSASTGSPIAGTPAAGALAASRIASTIFM